MATKLKCFVAIMLKTRLDEKQKQDVVGVWGRDLLTAVENLQKACDKEPTKYNAIGGDQDVDNKVSLFIEELSRSLPPEREADTTTHTALQNLTNLPNLLQAAKELEKCALASFHTRHKIGQYTGTILGIILGTLLVVFTLTVIIGSSTLLRGPSVPVALMLLVVAGAWMGWTFGKYVGESLSHFFSPTIAKADYATILKNIVEKKQPSPNRVPQAQPL